MTRPPLPPLPLPPHDPKSWLLNAVVGWRAMRTEGLSAYGDALQLALQPSSRRRLNEASGSFGGLVPPANLALAPGPTLYLLDPETATLAIFDPCECRFVTIPCLGGSGSEPGRFLEPQALGFYAGNLFVCDSGNHRLCLFETGEYRLRAIWQPPVTAGLSHPWRPTGIAFNRRGRVFVSDPANGGIHRFDRSGYWEAFLDGLGAVTHLASDCHGFLYAMVPGYDEVLMLDESGNRLASIARVEEVADRFAILPFDVDAEGRLHLGALCDPPAEAVFDPGGQPIVPAPPAAALGYLEQGTYLTEPLDSKIYRCQWHRIRLEGYLPRGTCISLATYTAETIQSEEHLLALPPESWSTRFRIGQMEEGRWDCLVTSGPGRYLYLRVVLQSNGEDSPILTSVDVFYPRCSPRRFLPAVFGEDEVSADFTDRFLGLFDTSLRSIESRLDHQAALFDPLSSPSEPDPVTGYDFLSWLASWIGVTLDRQMPEAKRRRYLARAAHLYRIRGTRQGLWEQLVFHLGMEAELCRCAGDQPKSGCMPEPPSCAREEEPPPFWTPPPLILEHYRLRRWLFLGAGRLGDEAVLWGKSIVNRSQLDRGARADHTQLITTGNPLLDPFAVHAHKLSVFVPACFGATMRRRKGLENLINREKPGHTSCQIVYVEPRFRIGIQSMIGLDAVIGRYPEGVVLGSTSLDRDAVLGEVPGRGAGPSFRIGNRLKANPD